MAGGQPLTKWLRLRLKKRQQERARNSAAVNDNTKPTTKPRKDARKRHLSTREDKPKIVARPSDGTQLRKQGHLHSSAASEGDRRPSAKHPGESRKQEQDRKSSSFVQDMPKQDIDPSKDASTHVSDKNMSVSSLRHISTVPVDAASRSSQAPSTMRNKKYRDIVIIEDSSILDSLPAVERNRLSQFKSMLTRLSCVSCNCENQCNDEELSFETATFDSKTLDSFTLDSRTLTDESRRSDSQTSDSSRSDDSATEATSMESQQRVEHEPESSRHKSSARISPPQERSSTYSTSLKHFDEPSTTKVSDDEANVGPESNSVAFIPIDNGRAVNIIMTRYSSDLQPPRSRLKRRDPLVKRSSTMDRIETLRYSPKKKEIMVSPQFGNRREWSTLTPFSMDEDSASSKEDFNDHEEDDIWRFDSLLRQGEPWMGW